MCNLKDNRVGIFIHGYGLGNAPSLINAGNMLANTGFTVDYYTYNTFIGDFKFNHHAINLFEIKEKNEDAGNNIKGLLPSPIRELLGRIYDRLNSYKNNFLDKFFYRKRMAECEEAYLKDIKHYVSKAEDIIGNRQYKCFVGAEPGGLMAAVMIGKKQGVPTIYYNLELRLSSELQTIRDKVIKKYEKAYNQFTVFTVTLDEERAEIIKKDHEIEQQETLIVPVCAEGPRFDEKTDWLRERFNLSKSDKIILYAGFVCEWAMCEELARAATSWPENRILILHSHGYHDIKYIEKLKKYEGEKVKISLEPVSYSDLQSFLASSDIGVALYKDLGKNFTLISSASGKLAHYFKSGLPVITNDYPSMKRVIDSYHCGECVSSPQDIASAMENIFQDYERMRSNAFLCYEEDYMFSKQFAKVVEKIKAF